MIGALARWRDGLLGRGDAAITVPVMDGALRPNRDIDAAQVVYQSDGLVDLASDGSNVFVATGLEVVELALPGPGAATVVAQAVQPITAIAAHPSGGVAFATDAEVRVVGGAHAGRVCLSAEARQLSCVTALQWIDADTLLICEGSSQRPSSAWKQDLMEKGRTGRVIRWPCAANAGTVVAHGLRWAFGAVAVAGEVWISESWAHRVVKAESGRVTSVLDGLPAYPSRLVASARSGAWLTCFAVRTQLVEFVLREDDFRRRMVAQIDPEYWVAPTLRSGKSFLEPMQAAHLKTMGVVKPWAPPRSYGLVLRLDKQGLVRRSFHSRFDGEHHGIAAVAECGSDLYLLSLGSGSVLRLPLRERDEELQS